MQKLTKTLGKLLSKGPAPNQIRIFTAQDGNKSIVYASEGDNLMEVTMPVVNQDLHLFGICNKELACTSCSVHIKNKTECLKQPKEEELDILAGLKDYREGETRMSCQIKLTKEMNDIEIEIASANKFI